MNWRGTPTLAAASALGLTLLLAGCSSSEESAGTEGGGEDVATLVDGGAAVIVANSSGTVTTNGPQRVMVALLGDGPNRYLGGQDAPATFEFRSEDGSVVDEVTGEWLSVQGSPLGLYVTRYTFPVDGFWEIRVKGSDTDAPASLFVGTDSSVPEPGDQAPPSVTATAADAASLEEITTDPSPNPAYYELSIADAVSSGEPSVIVFSTPAFCRTGICGPTMEIVKTAVGDRDDLEVVHVEPWDIEQARAGTLVPVDAMVDWNLPTEPWVFVVDAEGRITASFEGIVGSNELSEAIAALP